jgi:hypothetical protein
LDDYAVEVLLNQEDIKIDTDLLKNSKNVNIFGDSFVIQSSSSENLAVILTNVSNTFCEECFLLRVQIPVKKELKEKSYINLSTTLIGKNINNTLNTKDWDYYCSSNSCNFYNDGINIFLDNSAKDVVKIQIEVISDISSDACDGKEIYSSNKYLCIKKEDKDNIEGLLKGLSIIGDFEELFPSYKLTNSGIKSVYEISPDLNENFYFFMFNQGLSIGNKEDIKSLKWDVIVNNEIEWLRFNNILSINNNDIKEISNISRLGYSGVNKRIYFSSNNFSEEKWGYYYESSIPEMTSVKNCEDFDIISIPKDFLKVVYPSTVKINLYYLVPIIFTFILLLVLFVLLTLSRKKINKELEKEKREILKEKESL